MSEWKIDMDDGYQLLLLQLEKIDSLVDYLM